MMLFIEKIIKQKTLREIFYLFPLIELSIFSGLKDFTVGNDIYVYGNEIFYYASHVSFSYAAKSMERWGEIGYVLLNYLVGLFTKNAHVFYGVLTFVTVYIAYKLFRKFDAKLSVPFAMLAYMLYIYPLTFGVLRQGLAMSILSFSVYYFIQKKPMKAIIVGVVAYFFHDSSPIALIMLLTAYLLITFFENSKINENKWLAYGTIAYLLVAFLIPIVTTMLPPEFFSEIDSKYYYIATTIDFSRISYLRILLFSFPLIYFFRRFKEFKVSQNRELLYLYFINLTTIIFSGFSANMYVLFGRGSFYFYSSFIIFVCELIRLQKKQMSRLLEYLIFAIFAFISFYLLVYVGNYNNIFPYRSYLY